MPTIRLFLTGFLLIFQLAALAQVEIIQDTAERFIRQQTQGLPGKVTIRLGKIDASHLPPCTAHEAYSLPGARMMGKTSVGVRCLGPNIWNVIIPVEIALTGSYVTTTRAILVGQVIQASDLHVVTGDVSNLPTGAITDPETAIGKTLKNSLGSGQILRSNQLIARLVIQQGQSVRVVAQGNGFSVSADGKAMNNASEGQLVQIRMSSGQTITGTARRDGTVEVAN